MVFCGALQLLGLYNVYSTPKRLKATDSSTRKTLVFRAKGFDFGVVGIAGEPLLILATASTHFRQPEA